MMTRILTTASLVASLAMSSPSVNAELSLGVEPLSDPELSDYRGGFLTRDGLEIAIGLEQIVAVNGDTRIINRLTIPNLNQTPNGRLVDLHMDTRLEVISPYQGGGTRVSSNIMSDGWLTLVQNSIDSTVIQNIHQLNVELNNVGAGQPLPARLSDQLLQLQGR